MNYTPQTRREIKRECRARVAARLGSCIGVQFLYALPFVLLLVILYVSAFGRMLRIAAAGISEQYMAAMWMDGFMNTLWLVLLVMLAIAGPLMYGQMKFYIGLRRGEEPGVSVLFKPFTSLSGFWTGVKMSFCLFFRAFLWTLGPALALLVLGLLIGIIGMQSPDTALAANVGLIVLYVLWIAANLLIQVKVMTYQAGWVVINGNERYGVWAAARDGSAVFRGHYGHTLVFVLSFVLWYVLLFGLTALCTLLGVYGLSQMNSVGVFLLALAAAVLINIVLGGFLAAYQTTSLIGLYEFLEEQGRRPDDTAYGAPFAPEWTAKTDDTDHGGDAQG